MGVRINHVLKRGLRAIGIEMRRANHERNWGWDPFVDMRRLLEAEGRGTQPVILDVGANAGQSVFRFREAFADPRIHCFEPSPNTFGVLRRHTECTPNLKLNQAAVGSSTGTMILHENSSADMSSFLELGSQNWGTVTHDTAVPVTTVDQYCQESGIDRVDILKTDTQGFDLEVVRGAAETISGGKLSLIFLEITFCELYQNLPTLDEVYRELRERGFDLISFYEFSYQNNRAGWTDALFAYRGSASRALNSAGA